MTAAKLSETEARLLQRIEALEERCRGLEKKSSIVECFRGVHIVGTAYKRGDIVRRLNSLYLCLQNTQHAPGVTAAWTLFLKGERVSGA